MSFVSAMQVSGPSWCPISDHLLYTVGETSTIPGHHFEQFRRFMCGWTWIMGKFTWWWICGSVVLPDADVLLVVGDSLTVLVLYQLYLWVWHDDAYGVLDRTFVRAFPVCTRHVAILWLMIRRWLPRLSFNRSSKVWVCHSLPSASVHSPVRIYQTLPLAWE